MANDGREGATYGSSPGSSTGGMNIGAYGNLIMPEWRAEQPSYGPGTGSSYGYWAREYIGTDAGSGYQVFQPELIGSGCPTITPSDWINSGNVMLVQMPSCSHDTFFASLKAAGVSRALLALPRPRADSPTFAGRHCPRIPSFRRRRSLSTRRRQLLCHKGWTQVRIAEVVRRWTEGELFVAPVGLFVLVPRADHFLPRKLIADVASAPDGFVMTFPVEVARPWVVKESSSSRMTYFSSVRF